MTPPVDRPGGSAVVTVAGPHEVYPCRCGITVGNDGIHLHRRTRHFVVGRSAR